MKLEHVAINVEDPKAMADWYVKNLDMQIVRSTDQPPYMTFLADNVGQSMIEIYHNTEAGIPRLCRHPPSKPALCLFR